MKIESIIKRDPPTEVLLGDTAYKFQPDSKGRHVCEVTDKAHIARLLSIAEGFQIPDDEDAPKVAIPPVIDPPVQTVQPTFQPTQDPDVLLGADGYPAVIDLGNGKTADIADVIADAHELSGLTTADWNTLPLEVRTGLIDAVLDALADPEETSSDSNAANDSGPAPDVDEAAKKAKQDADEREALALEYKAKFGSKPHYKWTMDKIREELAKPTEPAKD